MAYMSQETKAKIVAAAKPILKKYGVKASFAVRHHSTLVVNIKSGKIDFIGNYNRVAGKRYANREQWQPATNYLDVNQYWYNEHFDGAARDFIEEIVAAVKSADWYDRSDAMTDYFDTAYYFDINIGRWNQPYALAA